MRKHAADAAPHPHIYRFRLKEVKADAAPHQMLLHQLVYDERGFCFGDASYAFTPAGVSMRSSISLHLFGATCIHLSAAN
jgi:hypothetical protein